MSERPPKYRKRTNCPSCPLKNMSQICDSLNIHLSIHQRRDCCSNTMIR
uniref:Uncharacterized protein n=1 Tax=Anguilla anguilla TaxID=7936 RepID=A0A0E9VLM7_ANGAN